MAIYHLSMKPISRSAGRSVTAAAAYRAGVEITDERTGEVHDYRKKGGVEHVELILPGGQSVDRAEFWNGVEKHHKRGDAVVGREVVIALPSELSPESRQALASSFAKEIVARYGVAADVAVHAPSKDGDNRNHHAHILLSACLVGLDGQLGKKAVALDPVAAQRPEPDGSKRPNAAEELRPRWAELVNAALARNRLAVRVDHRSHVARGIEDVPTKHLGPTATAMERKGRKSRAGQENREARRANRQRRNLPAVEAELERQAAKARNDFEKAKQARDGQRLLREGQRRHVRAVQPRMEGKADSRAVTGLAKYLSPNTYRVYDHPGRTIVYLVREKTSVIDKGDRITCGRGTGANPSAGQVEMMVAVAGCKGWRTVNLTGSDEFKRQAIAQLARKGIAVSNPELQDLYRQAQAALAAPTPAPAPMPPAPPPEPPKPAPAPVEKIDVAAAMRRADQAKREREAAEQAELKARWKQQTEEAMRAASKAAPEPPKPAPAPFEQIDVAEALRRAEERRRDREAAEQAELKARWKQQTEEAMRPTKNPAPAQTPAAEKIDVAAAMRRAEQAKREREAAEQAELKARWKQQTEEAMRAASKAAPEPPKPAPVVRPVAPAPTPPRPAPAPAKPAPMTSPGGEASTARPAPTLRQVEEATDRIHALDGQIEALDRRAAGLRDRHIDPDEIRRWEMDKMNQEAVAAGKPKPWEDRYSYPHHRHFERSLEAAELLRKQHMATPRPMMFGVKEYDAKAVELQRQIAGWQSAIQQRDRTLAARVEAATVAAQKEAAQQARQNAAERDKLARDKQPLVAERERAREALAALYDAVPVARHGDAISGKFLKARKMQGKTQSEVCSLIEQAGGRLVAVRGVLNVDAGRNVALTVDDSKDVYPREVAVPTPKGRGRSGLER